MKVLNHPNIGENQLPLHPFPPHQGSTPWRIVRLPWALPSGAAVLGVPLGKPSSQYASA